jgi:DNA-binding transcriptional LysR family regulator
MADATEMGQVDLEKGLKTNASNIALEMTVSGLGFTVSLVSLAQLYIQRKLLVEPFPFRPQSPWGYYISASGMSRGTAAKKLMEWIVTAGHAEETRSNGVEL